MRPRALLFSRLLEEEITSLMTRGLTVALFPSGQDRPLLPLYNKFLYNKFLLNGQGKSSNLGLPVRDDGLDNDLNS